MNKIKSFIYRFMYGRYGTDTLYWWLFGGALLCSILSRVFGGLGFGIAANVLRLFTSVGLVYAMFRFLSKNKYKRLAENRAFCQFLTKIKKKFELLRNRFRDRKTHVYKSCPKCKAVLRLPKSKGEHTVRCPKCGDRFDVRI